MSCEKNQNRTANAAGPSGGIPETASKFTHVATGVGHRKGDSRLETEALAAWPVPWSPVNKAVAPKTPDQRNVEFVKDGQRWQAMLELQEKYISRQISQADMKKLLGTGAEFN